MRDLRNLALLAAALVGFLLLAGLAVLVATRQDQPEVAPANNANGGVDTYAHRQAFSAPVVMLVQRPASNNNWTWLYHDDRSACVGQQDIVSQSAANPISVAGANVAIGSAGMVELELPAGSIAYPSMTVTLGDDSWTISYIPAWEEQGMALASFQGGVFATPAHGRIASSQAVSASLEVAPATAEDCYNLVSAAWKEQAVVAIAPAFDAVARTTPVPPTSTPGPTPTLFPTPGPTPTTVAPTTVALRPELSLADMRRTQVVEGIRDGYIVAEMYQDVRAGNYGLGGALHKDAWEYVAVTKACEADLLVAWQEGLTYRATPEPTFTPEPTWTPYPTWTPTPAEMALESIIISGRSDAIFSAQGILLATPEYYAVTPTPIPAPDPIPDNTVAVGIEGEAGRTYTIAATPRQVREVPGQETAYSITVEATQAGTWDRGTVGIEVWIPTSLEASLEAGQTAIPSDTGTCGVNSDELTFPDFFATTPGKQRGTSATFEITICPDTDAEWGGELIAVRGMRLQHSADAWVPFMHYKATSYIQIIEPTSPGPNTNPNTQNTTGGPAPVVQPTQPPQPTQISEPTPPYLQNREWDGWHGRTLSVDLDGIAVIGGVPDDANVYGWTEVSVGLEPRLQSPLLRAPAFWQNGALHLWGGSGRMVIPEQNFSIDAWHREMRVNIRVSPMPDCQALRLQWQRPASAIIRALDTSNPFAEWVPPSPTPAPTPTGPPVPVPDYPLYAIVSTSDLDAGEIATEILTSCDSDGGSDGLTGPWCWEGSHEVDIAWDTARRPLPLDGSAGEVCYGYVEVHGTPDGATGHIDDDAVNCTPYSPPNASGYFPSATTIRARAGDPACGGLSAVTWLRVPVADDSDGYRFTPYVAAGHPLYSDTFGARFHFKYADATYRYYEVTEYWYCSFLWYITRIHAIPLTSDYYLTFAYRSPGDVAEVGKVTQAQNPFELRAAFGPPSRLTDTPSHAYIQSVQAWDSNSTEALEGTWTLRE